VPQADLTLAAAFRFLINAMRGQSASATIGVPR
jgi:hypothetical protein